MEGIAMWPKLLLLIGVIWPAALLAEEPPRPPPASMFEMVSAEFGVFYTGEKGEQVFEPASIVPHKVGQRYGWVIEVQARLRSLSVREEYLLPSLRKVETSEETSNGETLNIKIPRRSQVSQRQLVPVDGKIFGEWAIGPEEPGGHRHLQVIVENEIAASFEFDVK